MDQIMEEKIQIINQLIPEATKAQEIIKYYNSK